MPDTRFIRFNVDSMRIVVLPLNTVDDLISLKFALSNGNSYVNACVDSPTYHSYANQLFMRGDSNHADGFYDAIAGLGDYAVWNQDKIVHIVSNLTGEFTIEHVPAPVLRSSSLINA